MPDIPEADAGRRRAAVAGVVVAVLVLRTLQLRSVGYMLHSGELAGLGSLAMDLRYGTVPDGLSVLEFVRRYQYGHFAQGTLVVQVMAAGLESIGLLSGWTFHGISIAFEALAAGLVAWLGVRVARSPVGALAALPWVLPPAFVVGWQLMPYGNHTEFLWVGGVRARRAADDPGGWSRRRWIATGGLLVAGVVLYRLHAALGVGILAATWLGRSAAVRRRGALTLGLATLLGASLILALWWAWPTPDADETLQYAFLPRVAWGRSLGEHGVAPGWRWSHLSAPRGALGGWPWRLGLGAVVAAGLAGAGPRRPLAFFAIGWASAAALAPLLFGEPHSEYLIPAVAALGLLAAPGLASPSPRWRAVAAAGLASMAVAGAVDNARLVRSAAWASTAGYDPLAVERELGVDALDADEVAFFSDLLSAGRGDRWVGLATSSARTDCPGQPLRGSVGALPRPGEGRCGCWERGALADRIRGFMGGAPWPNPPELLQIGRGAWVVCDRDLDRVRAALDGAPDAVVEQVVRGAQAERVESGAVDASDGRLQPPGGG